MPRRYPTPSERLIEYFVTAPIKDAVSALAYAEAVVRARQIATPLVRSRTTPASSASAVDTPLPPPKTGSPIERLIDQAVRPVAPAASSGLSSPPRKASAKQAPVKKTPVKKAAAKAAARTRGKKSPPKHTAVAQIPLPEPNGPLGDESEMDDGLPA
jgi:hypothetical protein